MADPFQSIVEAERLLTEGNLDQATRLAEQALLASPQAGMALNVLGLVALRRDNLPVAILLWETATRAAPALPRPWVSLGEAFFHLGQYDKTVHCFQEALRRNADLHDLRINLGIALQRLQRHEDAATELRRALAAQPHNAEGSLSLAASLHELGRTHQALDVLADAARRHPGNAKVLSNLGVLHEKLDQLERAVEYYKDALALAPTDAQTLFNRGSSLIQLLRIEEARQDWQSAMRSDGRNANYRSNLAILELMDGNLERGFELFESRFETRQKKFPVPCPEWDGSPLGHRHLLLYVEQGLGDALQFCRYVPVLKRLYPRSRISLATLPTLHPLLRSLVGLDGVLDVHPPYGPADVTLSLVSVPRVLKTTLATVPADVPYLKAEPALVTRWRQRLSALCQPGRPKVGLYWRGTQVDPNRTVRLDELAPLFAAGTHVSFVSLQKGAGEEELAHGPRNIAQIGHELLNYSDTAAVLESLDLLITIDTSIAHAAGALARPTWVMLPFRPDWRWLLARPDSPWYPTLKLFRQAARKDWSRTITTLAAELARWHI